MADERPTLPPGADDALADDYLRAVSDQGEWATSLAYLMEIVAPRTEAACHNTD